MRRKNPVGTVAFLVGAAGLVFSGMISGCASTPPANVKAVQCEADKIVWEVAQEAEIAEMSCAMGSHELEPSLIYTVTLKNASDQPQRYRLHIFLEDMDKAAGFLVPIKGNPPVLAPGAQETVKIPFMKTTTWSAKTVVRVRTISSED